MPDASSLMPDFAAWPGGAVRLLPMLALLALAAVIDHKHRKIPNWLNLALLLGGIATATVRGGLGWDGLAGSLAGAGLGFVLMLHAFVFRFSGGGDVKLLTACGAWLGPVGMLILFALQAIIGMVLVLGQAIHQGKLIRLLRNTAVLTGDLVHAKQLGMDDVTATAKSMKSIDRPLPYAVPVLVAALALPLFV
jgi:prepilin peptidase CpaA